MTQDRSSKTLRASLPHPVLDADGHVIEVQPLFEEWFFEFARAQGGHEAAHVKPMDPSAARMLAAFLEVLHGVVRFG